MIHRSRWWLVVMLLAAVAVVEWLHEPAWLWVLATGLLLGAGALLATRPWRRADTAALVVLAVMTVFLLWAQRGLATIGHDWPRERERRVTAASRRLAGELSEALRQAERAIERARPAATYNPRAAFDQLERSLPPDGPETGLALFETTGTPRAWAGRHRILPRAAGDSIGVVADGSYIILETRRHLETGRVLVASVLVWADPAIPGDPESVARRFARRRGVGLAVYPAGLAPAGPDIFDYEQPTTTGSRVLFSVQPLPPEQGPARERLQLLTSGVTVWLLLALVAALVLAARSTAGRFLALLLLPWLALRSPPGRAVGMADLFSPAVFFRPLLGPISGSAGLLGLTGALVILGAVWFWRRGYARRWSGVGLGILLLLAAPYVIRELGRGITPPIDGVPVDLWLTWEVTLLLATTAMILPVAALFRGRTVPPRTPWTIPAGIAVAIVAAVAGIWVWGPRIGWPPWYTFLWTPALVLVTLPAPRRSALVGIAIVAGSAAALVTWGAELEGRIDAARRDITSLGAEADPLALPPLERLGALAADEPIPLDDTDLFRLWKGSAFAGGEYPFRLDLWTADGRPAGPSLVLDSLDVSAALLSAMVRSLDSGETRRSAQVTRVPGIHAILIQRLDSGFVLSATVGPRTRLIPPTQLGRLLRRPSRGPPLYSLALLPPQDAGAPSGGRVAWRREGWRVQGDRELGVGEGVRHAHATVNLRGPVPILVRGALVVLLDIAVIAALWFLASLLAGGALRVRGWSRAIHSYQARLALTLSLFFLVPVAGFAAWSFARLDDEAERGRDLLVAQTLRAATPRAAGLLRRPGEGVSEGLEELSRESDAELALYSGGAMVGSSSSVLGDVGLVSPLMDPGAFQDLALEDGLEVTRRNPLVSSLLVGYRVVRPGPAAGVGVLATPRLAVDPMLAAQQGDLVLGLLLATLVGIGAALIGARRAARSLARPVDNLGLLARALGRGEPVPALAGEPPIEFEPVFAAFSRMAADIRSSQAALEAARRRTATVLATVATGVVALDRDGRILLANERARDLLDLPLADGTGLLQVLPAAWRDLGDAVRPSLGAATVDEAGHEFDVEGRRYGLQLAPLGGELRGVVLALSDLTDVSRAERVLAWGEMARQVAHEIKNPLTPLRLGVQHLRRVQRDRPADLSRVVVETSGRILAEIDRLDTIARAFSRFGAPETGGGAMERVDLAGTAREVVELYGISEEGARVTMEESSPATVAARRDEVKEVLVNLLENARHAGAAQVEVSVAGRTLAVRDDGHGIPADQLPQIFQPRFSTTTSGSGLGLAIVRRLVEGWGATIEVRSRAGEGTTVTVQFAGA